MSRFILTRFILSLVLIISVSASHSFAADPTFTNVQANNLQENQPVYFNSKEGMQIFSDAQYKSDFFDLANYFTSQDNKLFCGPTSAVIVLNALQLGKTDTVPLDTTSISPQEGAYLPKNAQPFFNKYTQNNIFDANNNKSKIEILGQPIDINGKLQSDYGMQLKQLAKLLNVNGAKVTMVVADQAIIDSKIKQDLINNLSTQNNYVIVNYLRSLVGQEGKGHISPLGAYDEKSDRFLVMDVNPNAYPFAWVKSDALIAAMRSFDTTENRGYLMVE